MADSIGLFVRDLAQAETGALVNQYAIEVAGLDRHGGANQRCANLAAYLEPRIGAALALVGEAPSAHGARFSGIAFTAERTLPPGRRTSAPDRWPNGLTELSATVLRKALVEAGLDAEQVVLWNVVPFHPARALEPLRNRLPTASEFELGSAWLERFLRLVRPERVAAVGRSAQRLLPLAIPLRHPAFGGGRELREGLAALSDARGSPKEVHTPRSVRVRRRR